MVDFCRSGHIYGSAQVDDYVATYLSVVKSCSYNYIVSKFKKGNSKLNLVSWLQTISYSYSVSM